MLYNNLLGTTSIEMISSDYKSGPTSVGLFESSLNSKVSCMYVVNNLCILKVIYTVSNETIILITTSTVSVVVVIVIIVICLVVSSIVYLKKKHQLHEVGGERVRNYLLF